jgi:hypothetical protein
MATHSDCEHRWYWRRRRNQDFGFWECVRCWLKTDRVPLDEHGRAALTPEGALWPMTTQSSGPSGESKPTIPEVLPLVQAYYAKPGNFAGGSLHIVLDDGNVNDGSVQFCIDYAREKGDEDGIALGMLLLRMSKTQRSKLYASRKWVG